MTPTLYGVHHVTAIAGPPQDNVDFYVGVLGLRLVKRSVNQDDPGTYHLFYGDAVGSPGTELTFFAWPSAPRGRIRAAQIAVVALAIPPESIGFWRDRLDSYGVRVRGPEPRFGEDVLAFDDPDGLAVELVAGPGTARRALWQPWEQSAVTAEHQIRGIHAVTITERDLAPTVPFLTERLAFTTVAEHANRHRLVSGDGSGGFLDLVVQPDATISRGGAGTIHHVAWRTPDDAEHAAWHAAIQRLRVPISDIIDRFWFKSIYFHEPGGALFEIATDGPGFAADEPVETLGSRLVLPPWLEARRAQIEATLLPIQVPVGSA
jgi:glyoxalase family protein